MTGRAGEDLTATLLLRRLFALLTIAKPYQMMCGHIDLLCGLLSEAADIVQRVAGVKEKEVDHRCSAGGLYRLSAHLGLRPYTSSRTVLNPLSQLL